jgi:hypothetical protein
MKFWFMFLDVDPYVLVSVLIRVLFPPLCSCQQSVSSSCGKRNSWSIWVIMVS